MYAARTLDQDDVDRLTYYGIDAAIQRSDEPVDPRLVLGGAAGVLLVTLLVVGMIVALSASEGRGDAATLAAVGGTPVPWAGLAVLVLGVPLLPAGVGWLVTPTRLALTRRTG